MNHQLAAMLVIAACIMLGAWVFAWQAGFGWRDFGKMVLIVLSFLAFMVVWMLAFIGFLRLTGVVH